MIRTIAMVLLLQSVAHAEPERMAAHTPSGFVSAYFARNGDSTIEERIPRGETVERWSKMITVQRFGGIARVGGRAFLERLAAGVKQGCPGAITTSINDAVVNGRVFHNARRLPIQSGDWKAGSVLCKSLYWCD